MQIGLHDPRMRNSQSDMRTFMHTGCLRPKLYTYSTSCLFARETQLLLS